MKRTVGARGYEWATVRKWFVKKSECVTHNNFFAESFPDLSYKCLQHEYAEEHHPESRSASDNDWDTQSDLDIPLEVVSGSNGIDNTLALTCPLRPHSETRDVLGSQATDSDGLAASSAPTHCEFALFDSPNGHEDSGVQRESDRVQRGIRIGRKEKVE